MDKYNRFSILILSLATVPLFAYGAAVKKVEYETYINPRFQFSVKVPQGMLLPEPPPENGDGQAYNSKDKQVHMEAYGHYNAVPFTWKEEFQDQLDDLKGTQVTYKSFKKNSFTISGYKGDKIFYKKELLVIEDGDEVFLVFKMEYPKKDKEAWDAIVKTCAGSLKKTSGPSSWIRQSK